AAVGLGWARTPAHYGGLAALKLAWVLALSATGLWRNAYPWVPAAALWITPFTVWLVGRVDQRIPHW
ncbi:MAG: hypothetical protein ACOY94_08235, partial [Bacillota bacterium]